MAGKRLLIETAAYRPFVRWAGSFQLKRALRPHPHRGQVSYVIHLVRKGRIVFEWPDGGRTDVSDGKAVIVPPGTPTVTRVLRASELLTVHFAVDQNPLWEALTPEASFGLRDAAAFRLLQPRPEEVWGFSLPRNPAAAWCKRAAKEVPLIAADWQSWELLRHVRAHHALAGLLLALAEEMRLPNWEEHSLSPEERIGRAEMAFIKNMHSYSGVEEMARASGYERSYFSVVYRKLRRESPHKFVERIRLGEAMRLLGETRLPIREVAAHVGYSDQTSFTRFFKRMTGRSPGRFRSANPAPAAGRRG